MECPSMFVQLTKDYLGRKAGERLDVGEADGRDLIHGGAGGRRQRRCPDAGH